MKIKSHRLGFRRIQKDSFDFLMNYLSRGDTTKFLPLGRPYTSTEVAKYIDARMEHWQQHDFGMYLVYLQPKDICIGYCGLEYAGNTDYVDLRYGLVMKHWGKGFAKEAALKCLEYGFMELQLEAIYGVAHPENLASIAVMLKIGMTKVENVCFYDDSVLYYRILNKEWLDGEQ